MTTFDEMNLRVGGNADPGPNGEPPIPAGDTTRTERADAIRRQLLDDHGLAGLPDPEWLIEGHLHRHGLSLLWGPYGACKTFTAVSLAGSIATGTPWLGRPVHATGPVIYVAAEGATGIKRRWHAWRTHHRIDTTGVLFLPRPINLEDHDDAQALADVAAYLGAEHVILDTLNRCSNGEEDARMMNTIIANCALIQATGAGVTLVHHAGWNASGHYRGHSSLGGALDTEWAIEPTGDGTALLRCQKLKEAESPPAIRFELTPTGDSAVPTPTAHGHEPVDQIDLAAEKLLPHIGTTWQSRSAIVRAARDAGNGVRDDTARTALTRLATTGRADHRNTGRSNEYRLPEQELPDA